MKSKTVLVTGASKGIGRAISSHLAHNHWTVFAGVRKDSDANILKQEHQNIIPVKLDVTDPDLIEQSIKQIKETSGQLHALVNNAGVAVSAPLEYVPLDALKKQLDINVIGQVAVSQACLPLLRETRGHIVMIGSIAGRISYPLTGPYHASKAALDALSDSLRLELKPWGIKVVLIEPGAIATPIWQTAIQTAESLYERMPEAAKTQYGQAFASSVAGAKKSAEEGISPKVVAQCVEKALNTDSPRHSYLVGQDAWIGSFVAMLPGHIRDLILAKISPIS